MSVKMSMHVFYREKTLPFQTAFQRTLSPFYPPTFLELLLIFPSKNHQQNQLILHNLFL